MTNRTDWAALRALKSAVGSLPPAENIDRAQVAALGAAGPAAGGEWVSPETRARRIVDEAERKALDPFRLDERGELLAFVADEIRQANAAYAEDLKAANAGMLWMLKDIEGFLRTHGYDTRLVCEVIRDCRRTDVTVAMPIEERDRLMAAVAHADELRAAVRRWHAGAPSWNAEDDLYHEVLRLAGVESGTPAGPPVAPAGAGLDVERLVEALVTMLDEGGRIADPELCKAYLFASDGTPDAGMRALVLAALGIEEAANG